LHRFFSARTGLPIKEKEMANSSKKTKETVPDSSAADPINDRQTANGVTKKKSAAAKAAAPKPKRKKTAGKPRASTPAESASVRKSGVARAKKSGVTVSDDHIRMRAYFISQERLREGRPGSSDTDWLEARRQLEEQASLPA
jgi:flagellar hook-length control protein FliK